MFPRIEKIILSPQCAPFNGKMWRARHRLTALAPRSWRDAINLNGSSVTKAGWWQ
jgi:hypothetical protein